VVGWSSTQRALPPPKIIWHIQFAVAFAASRKVHEKRRSRCSDRGEQRMKLQRGQVAVVTGAASGIGLALAERFASMGLSVVLADGAYIFAERGDPTPADQVPGMPSRSHVVAEVRAAPGLSTSS